MTNRAAGFLLTLSLALVAAAAGAQEHARSPYAGLETRPVKSLSETDIDELRRGAGWGLALPAELNGVPGPAHLLELKDEIGLLDEQVAAIEAIYEEMKAEAIPAGERFIATEEAIEAAFVSGGIDAGRLRALIEESAAARAALRFVHLSRHLQTPPLLTADQIARYQVLRGYAADPCASVPEGHDPEMWRRHNRCD